MQTTLLTTDDEQMEVSTESSTYYTTISIIKIADGHGVKVKLTPRLLQALIRALSSAASLM